MRSNPKDIPNGIFLKASALSSNPTTHILLIANLTTPTTLPPPILNSLPRRIILTRIIIIVTPTTSMFPRPLALTIPIPRPIFPIPILRFLISIIVPMPSRRSLVIFLVVGVIVVVAM